MSSSPRPSHKRTSSHHDHAPVTPSSLRQSYTASTPPSPEDEHHRSSSQDAAAATPTAPRSLTTPERRPSTTSRGTAMSPPASPLRSPARFGILDHVVPLAGPSATKATETTGLLKDWREHAHPGPCNHGTFSPRPGTPSGSVVEGLDSDAGEDALNDDSDTSGSSVPLIDAVVGKLTGRQSWKKKLAKRMKSKTMNHTSHIAEEAGIEDSWTMYLSYYVPFLTWMRQYKFGFLKGDLVAAITMASFYLPMALSLADNLAHVPPINGLYSFVFNPIIYALLGSCPQMVVGPEAAGSLLVGTVVKRSIDLGRGEDGDSAMHAQICGVVTGMAGATVFAAGITRLGFLDSVLSRPFLRGFISAVGFVIAVDQLVPELGLTRIAEKTPGVGHGSSVEKLRFMFTNLDKVHRLTFAIAFTSFAIIMVFRELKKRLQPRYPGVAYIPDRFAVVVASAIFTWYFEWEKQGVAILGAVESASGHLFTFRWPFQTAHMTHIRDAMSTSFLIALLGFFESSVAAKSLSGSNGAIQGMNLSPNRELVALGTANLVGACFMSLPAFGGYGRSKVNHSTGGVSPMSSIFLSLITLTCICFLLPYFYYLPKPVLSSMISVVAWSLIEECPNDILFFVRVRGWGELGLMAIIFLCTIFYSLSLGIAIGVGLSVLQVIRHSTRPRIQILGRHPGTNRFDNAEAHPERLEFFEGCLIVKIPEPLTFANTGELKTRLRRLEIYGTSKAHPALPRLRGEDSNRNVVFDIHGVTEMDGSGAQVLEEIVRSYVDRGVRVFFSRGQREGKVWDLMVRSGIVELVGGEDRFVGDVIDALKMTEVAEGTPTRA
ncbi:sulfate transporter 4.1 [Zalerion maritima]|uniref:Sulfate transporter 4.1 n=1 Tax=Zalerion maritima TaxID=339359 RepID=A0AAD5WUA8_9PEZI|nr:sulfate transporter 4.1 [Zalerion maritima]